MKHSALFTLLLGLAGPALAAQEPCVDAYGNLVQRDPAAPVQPPADEVERARAAIQAGQDLNLAMAPSAAGPAYDDHRYLNGGHFGPRTSATGCE